jgi:glycosyltransferase involved in cell wall biosynthesis
MPRFVLILMVKNEEKILRRCMAAVEGLVDAYVITDTGSTDNTTDIAVDFLVTHEGCLDVNTWENFGHNRSLSFKNAQGYCKAKGWDLKDSYGLLLDADMLFVPGTLKTQSLGELGYTMIQMAGGLEYPNTRLVRMDHEWVCKGVTHEYWDGPCTMLPKSVCYIDDRNDGGCKADKFPRDLALLEKALQTDPDNVRYLFYVAQTHHSMGNLEKAIEAYKRRIAAGGWYEEVWYSHYMIAKSYDVLKQPYLFEEWVQRGYDYYPKRSEGLYVLTRSLRERGQHYKAYHYLVLGKAIPLPSDSLFIETDVYNGLFDYEQSVLDYYVKSDMSEGLKSSVRFMLKQPYHQQNVVSNLKFYVAPIRSTRTPLRLPNPFGGDFKPSAVSLLVYPLANVRYVNYTVINGAFTTPGGVSLCENACVNLWTRQIVSTMDEETVALPTIPHHIRGLEDVRVVANKDGNFAFTATVHNYEQDAVRILRGRYSPSGTYSECKILPSPTKRTCEKNWLPIARTDTMIYDWHPFTLVNTSGEIVKTIKTPPMFSLFRGSAPPIRVRDAWWTMVHFVDYAESRNYYHALVELSDNLVPVRMTLPFVFASVGIEYCLSMRYADLTLFCYAGINETDVSEFAIPVSAFTWVPI